MVDNLVYVLHRYKGFIYHRFLPFQKIFFPRMSSRYKNTRNLKWNFHKIKIFVYFLSHVQSKFRRIDPTICYYYLIKILII